MCGSPRAPEDGTIQIAIKTGVDGQLAGFECAILAGRNLRGVPFDSVDELMGSLEDPCSQSDPGDSVRTSDCGGYGNALEDV